MLKAFFILAILLSSNSFAAERSDPFFLMVTGRVCDSAGACQRYNGGSGNYQIDLTTNAQGKSGEMKITYEIEGVSVTNSLNLYVREFNGESQTELYIEIQNSTDSSSASGVSVLAKSLRELNMISPNGVAFEANGYTITPELVIGPYVQ